MALFDVCRIAARSCALGFFTIATMTVAIAGPGHDHGGDGDAALSAPSSPRIVAVSDAYELVGILLDGTLTLYLDTRATTEPVTDARLDVTVGAENHPAKPQPNGTYTLVVPSLAEHGDHDLVIAVAHGSARDLLMGTLREGGPAAGDNHDHASADGAHSDAVADKTDRPAPEWLRNIGLDDATAARKLQSPWTLAGFALAFGVAIGAAARHRVALTILLAACLTLAGIGLAVAGPGHDHGEAGATAQLGDAPRRMPDGELFLPKPTQRLLNIRTQVLTPSDARAMRSLIGRVITDPNRSGLVQSSIDGRILPTAKGLPILGQRVEAGDPLVTVEPAFAPIDASDVLQTSGDLLQRINVLDAQIRRQQTLVDKRVASPASLQDLEIERDGLIARRAELATSRSAPEVLTAPVSGVIADVRVAAGQVVKSADTLFTIIDPDSLWVEAVSYDPTLVVGDTPVKARAGEGDLFDLTFVGRSRTLQRQATVMQFRVDHPTAVLSVGSPVKVLVEAGAAVTGLIVSRSAIAQAPNGQMVAFKRLEPERYMPAPVRFTDIDSERVAVTGGLQAGDQIIVRNAPLVNQIR